MGMFTHDITKCKKIKGAADKNGLKMLHVNKVLIGEDPCTYPNTKLSPINMDG